MKLGCFSLTCLRNRLLTRSTTRTYEVRKRDCYCQQGGLPGYRDGRLAFFLLGTQRGSRVGAEWANYGFLTLPLKPQMMKGEEGKKLSRHACFQHCNRRLGYMWAKGWTSCPVPGLAKAEPLFLVFFSVWVTETEREARAPACSHSTGFCHPCQASPSYLPVTHSVLSFLLMG